jgi:metal-dependent hydrolase (beta-lactamase superfamily II)
MNNLKTLMIFGLIIIKLVLGQSGNCIAAEDTLVTIYNVGQGNCVLVQHKKEAILIDCGHSPTFLSQNKEQESHKKIKKDVIEIDENDSIIGGNLKKLIEDIKNLGNGNTLKAVVISHPDEDHYLLLPEVFCEKNFKEGLVIENLILGGFYSQYKNDKYYNSKQIGAIFYKWLENHYYTIQLTKSLQNTKLKDFIQGEKIKEDIFNQNNTQYLDEIKGCFQKYQKRPYKIVSYDYESHTTLNLQSVYDLYIKQYSHSITNLIFAGLKKDIDNYKVPHLNGQESPYSSFYKTHSIIDNTQNKVFVSTIQEIKNALKFSDPNAPLINILAMNVGKTLGFKREDKNTDSIVLQITAKNKASLIVTGDATKETWEYIIKHSIEKIEKENNQNLENIEKELVADFNNKCKIGKINIKNNYVETKAVVQSEITKINNKINI